MAPLLRAAGLAALLALLAAGTSGTVFGTMMGLREVRAVPAVLGLIALLLLRDGVRGLGPAAGWALLGAAGAVAWRGAAGVLGQDGWMAQEDPTRVQQAIEAGWWAMVAGLAWAGRGGAARAWRLAGPLLAACLASTRIGAHGQALVPVLFEDTVREALPVALNVVAGLAAGLLAVLGGGWVLHVLARVPERVATAGTVLAALAAAAAIGHMLQV